MTTSHPIFAATPQFDGGRWKLRLEYTPLNYFTNGRQARRYAAVAGRDKHLKPDSRPHDAGNLLRFGNEFSHIIVTQIFLPGYGNKRKNTA
jgi:hypothetical protein